jgi:hypothetical protein
MSLTKMMSDSVERLVTSSRSPEIGFDAACHAFHHRGHQSSSSKSPSSGQHLAVTVETDPRPDHQIKSIIIESGETATVLATFRPPQGIPLIGGIMITQTHRTCGFFAPCVTEFG